jgi:hypothetical protein
MQQGVTIGRIFANGGYYFILGIFFENDRYVNNPKMLVTFQRKSHVLFFIHNVLGYTLGVFPQNHLVTLLGSVKGSDQICKASCAIEHSHKFYSIGFLYDGDLLGVFQSIVL